LKTEAGGQLGLNIWVVWPWIRGDW